MRYALTLACLMSLAALSGCDLLGIESATTVAAKRDAEGKAIGGACRHAGRAIEDCYALNRKADKGAVFAGWREMNDYMRENKIEAVAPTRCPAPGRSTGCQGRRGGRGRGCARGQAEGGRQALTGRPDRPDRHLIGRTCSASLRAGKWQPALP